MNLLFMQNGFAPYGIPRNGLVALYDPWRDTYGKNIMPVGSEDFETGWYSYDGSTATITQNQSIAEWGTDKATRITCTAGNSDTTTKRYLPTQLTSIPGCKYSVSLYIKNVGNTRMWVFNNVNSASKAIESGEAKKVILNPDADRTSPVQIALLSNKTTDGFDIIAYQPQINLGQLYPYALPSGLPQSLTDYTGRGNNAQLGSTAGADTNDPAWSGGLTFGTDDYCKSSSPAFDDLSAFTCITVCKPLSGGGGRTGRIFDKNKRFMAYSWTKLQFFQYYDGVGVGYRGNIPTVFNQNVITCCMYDGTVPNLFLNTTKNIVEIFEGSASGNIQSDTTDDLFVGNRAGADRNFDGTIYCQLWYNRILSDAEYLQAYNGLRRLMSARGVVI